MQTRKTGIRAQQADRTRDNILKAAVQVFSREGFAGGRVELIGVVDVGRVGGAGSDRDESDEEKATHDAARLCDHRAIHTAADAV